MVSNAVKGRCRDRVSRTAVPTSPPPPTHDVPYVPKTVERVAAISVGPAAGRAEQDFVGKEMS